MSDDYAARASGLLSPRAFELGQISRFIHSIKAAPTVKFDGRRAPTHSQPTNAGYGQHDNSQISNYAWAHAAGTNTISIDRFEGRFLLSGGSDSSLRLWDLENASRQKPGDITYKPLASIARASSSHRYGITSISFFPFDSLAFLTGSYDHALKVYATETFAPSATFDMGSVIYQHAVSPIASHLLVACSTQHSTVRLVDLKSGVNAHSLPGHHGAVLSVSWSPKDEYILASGGADGTARLWDIRRSASSLGVLDHEDSVGIAGEDGLGLNARAIKSGKAHTAACNGVVWKDDGRFLVTAGHDGRVRVWNTDTGANALSHFGPLLKNSVLSTLLPLLIPDALTAPWQTLMMYPNEKDILMFDVFEGTLLSKLRVPTPVIAQATESSGQRNIRSRATALAWRAHSIEMLSAHTDGIIRAWAPQDAVDDEYEIGEGHEPDECDAHSQRKRKREVLDQVFKELTKQQITFT